VLLGLAFHLSLSDVEALPKSGYGKLTKRAIREELEARGNLPLEGVAPASDRFGAI
jgi:acyl-CoA synthetase (AMP-forming)/AMP-acid ligase II